MDSAFTNRQMDSVSSGSHITMAQVPITRLALGIRSDSAQVVVSTFSVGEFRFCGERALKIPRENIYVHKVKVHFKGLMQGKCESVILHFDL